MSEILTKSSERVNAEGTITRAYREILLPMPDCLKAENISALIEIIGEDVLFAKVKAQLTIDFRSHIRAKLESTTEDQLTNSDDDIASLEYSEWKPEARVRKTSSEKAAALLGKMTPAEVQAAMIEAGLLNPDGSAIEV